MKLLADAVIAWLMRPRVRRVRRWAFLVTVPVALVVAHVYGVHQGALVIAVRGAPGHGGHRRVEWVLTALHAYALLWLWGFFLGPRAYPHRIGARTAVLRAGPMYRVALPLPAVTSATARTEQVRGANALTERDGVALLAARGRVDVWLELAEPVKVQRPLHEPLVTRRLAVASDDPGALVERLLARSSAPAARGVTCIEGSLGLLAGLDLAGLGRDVLQPG